MLRSGIRRTGKIRLGRKEMHQTREQHVQSHKDKGVWNIRKITSSVGKSVERLWYIKSIMFKTDW